MRNISRVFALALAHVSWVGLCVCGALALVQLVVSEWQRRRTLLDLIKHASAGDLQLASCLLGTAEHVLTMLFVVTRD